VIPNQLQPPQVISKLSQEPDWFLTEYTEITEWLIYVFREVRAFREKGNFNMSYFLPDFQAFVAYFFSLRKISWPR